MKQITIVSGKGGVGKTSLSATLARLLAPVAVADADVDAADLHLVLPHTITQSARVIGGLQAHIDQETCSACGACAQVCRFDAISLHPQAQVDHVACEGCGACAFVCAAEAIELEPHEHGSLLEAQANTGPLVYARLDPGAENSGRLVSRVRERAQQLATAAGLDTVLIDGPPGCGCAATAAITGCDLVMAVCEPSRSSLHDLHRMLDLVDHFHLPAVAVINKADLHSGLTEQLHDELAKRQVPVLAALPYDPVFTQAQQADGDIINLAGPILTSLLSSLRDSVLAKLHESACTTPLSTGDA